MGLLQRSRTSRHQIMTRAVIAIASLLVGCANPQGQRPAAPPPVLKQFKPGMTRADAFRVLGSTKPRLVVDQPFESWYQVKLTDGCLDLFFAKQLPTDHHNGLDTLSVAEQLRDSDSSPLTRAQFTNLMGNVSLVGSVNTVKTGQKSSQSHK